MELQDFRQDYSKDRIDEAGLPSNPLAFFERWFRQVLDSGKEDPTAMVLATANAEGKPSARVVLLKSFSADTFVFYTHYDSRKARDLADNPGAALLFYWPEFQRQVRVEGLVSKLETLESDAYFSTRPRESQIAAIVSPQSQRIPSSEFLEHQRASFSAEKQGAPLQRPDNWGGFQLSPFTFEFWQGRPSRLHDRIMYAREAGTWEVFRLAP